MFRVAAVGRLLPVALLSALAVAFLLLDATQAQTDKGKKYALLVGVKDYLHPDLASLSYTENDVVELADALKGFAEVVVLTTSRGAKDAEASPTARNIRTQLGRLLKKATRHDTILIALAGHGLQLKLKDRGEEEGFFCPTDARPGEDVTFDEQSKTMISFSELFKELKESYVGVKLLLVDACRNNPRAGRSLNADTLPLARAPNGLAALFSCSSGERAFETDRLGKGHGVFFHYVIQGLKGEAKNRRGEVTWGRLAEHVTEKVSDEVPKLIKGGARQTPEERKTLKGKAPVLVAGLGAGAPREDPPARKVGVKKEAPGTEKVVEDKDKTITNSIGMKLVRIPPGTFMMGSPKTENGDYNERPQHQVTITKPFYMGVYTVTQEEYEKVMGSNPSAYSAKGWQKAKVAGMTTSRFPVETVSWHDAVQFCEKLSALEKEKADGREYRLPTEAEWEYACRAGTTTRYHSGDDEDDLMKVGWYKANSGGRTHNVGKKKANAWGLFDMHGNVFQWCHDRYPSGYKEGHETDPKGPKNGEARVLRGGSYGLWPSACRAASRAGSTPEHRLTLSWGFRVVCGAARAP
jgi:formylglycine-generating enzyme required for sulfatase activity